MFKQQLEIFLTGQLVLVFLVKEVLHLSQVIYHQFQHLHQRQNPMELLYQQVEVDSETILLVYTGIKTFTCFAIVTWSATSDLELNFELP